MVAAELGKIFMSANRPHKPRHFILKSDSWDKQRLFLLLQNGTEAIVTSPHFEFVDLATLPDDKLFYRPEQKTSEHKDYQVVEDLVFREISKSTAISTRKLISMCAALTECSREFIEGCLRLLVANGTCVASSNNSKVRLRLSSKGKRQEQERSFAASFAHELVTQAEQIGNLIAHGPTKGSYREELLRELLQRYIPQRYHAATGFIYGRDKQLDIIVYDQIDYAPIFRTGNLVVVPPESVRAIIEVKSTLTPAKLTAALRHLDDFRYVPGLHMPPAFLGVFAFTRTGTSKALASEIADYYRDDVYADLDRKALFLTAYDPIDAVCVLQKDLITVDHASIDADSGRRILSPVVVELENSSERAFQASMFFARLSQYLRFPFEGPKYTSSIFAHQGGQIRPKSVSLINGTKLWGCYDPDAIEAAALNNSNQIGEFERGWNIFNSWLTGEAWVLPNDKNNT